MEILSLEMLQNNLDSRQKLFWLKTRNNSEPNPIADPFSDQLSPFQRKGWWFREKEMAI
jgi:hypothetical protein